MASQEIQVPLSVPKNVKDTYLENMTKITKSTDKALIFAADHKIEHLNKDFWNLGVPCENKSCPEDTEHIFRIAKKGFMGTLCTQLGLIARYGEKYPDINYMVKINSRTDIVETQTSEPLSLGLYNIDDVIEMRDNNNLSICGVGYTIYLGSIYEPKMLTQASQTILKAHRAGLVTVLWVYPKGVSVPNEQSEDIIAGAAGVAHALGADFVKVKSPKADTSEQSAQKLIQATTCAGNTGVICAGGELTEVKNMLTTLHQQISIGGSQGCAIGRNIYQRSLEDAITVSRATFGIVSGQLTLEQALDLCKNVKP